MYRLATMLALLIVLVAGCGDSETESSESGSAAVARETAADDSQRNADSTSKAKRADATRADPKTAAKAPDAEYIPDREEQQAAHPEEISRDAFIEQVVQATLLRYGLELHRVKINRPDRALIVMITEETACNAVASQEPSMRQSILGGVRGVRSVRFEVADTGEELGYYVLRCDKPTMPNGPGRVVLEHTGVGGPWNSKTFRIRSNRWAVEWENQAGSLTMLVIGADEKTEGQYFEPISSSKPESGRKIYRRPGIFKLNGYGAAQWTVRVKELPSTRRRG